MANEFNSNTLYIDTASTAALTRKNIRVSYITFTSSGAGDNLILKDTDGSGALKISIKNAVANDTITLSFDENPLVFPNAIYIDTLTSGATATLVLKTGQ